MTRSQDITDTLFAIGFTVAALMLTAIVGMMITIIDVHLFGEGFGMMQTIHAAGPMMLFRVTAGGVDYGTYEGRDEEDALDAFIEDAGYDSREDLPEHIGPKAFDVTEMELRNGGARGTVLAPVDA